MGEPGDREAKILVVEDDDAVRNLLTDLLEDAGFEVLQASNGVEGVRQTFAETPDVVLTDIMMPDMGGIAFIQRVRSQVPARSLPIIVVSALSKEDHLEKAFEAGATDYLVKPFRPFELLARVQVALDRRVDPRNLVTPREEDLEKVAAGEIIPGSRIDRGKYRIVAEIGRGGMGKIYHAEHTGYGVDVALKVLEPELARKRRDVLRFLREVRVASQLDHPHIVRVLDVGFSGDVYYYAMEKLPAHSVGDEVREFGPMPEDAVMGVGLQVSSALARMHELGFLHRDVKPDNILFADRERVKLIDFGLACAVDDERLTREGAFVGTPGYVAPENIAYYQDPLPPADIYGLGVTLYFAASGVEPFPGQRAPTAVIAAQVLDDPVPVREANPTLSRGLAKLVMRMVTRSPSERFSSMREVSGLLEGLLDRQTVRNERLI